MKLSSRVVILFYVMLVMFFSAAVLLIALRWIDYGTVSNLVYAIYTEKDLRLVLMIWISILLFLNFIFYRLLVGNTYIEKTIAFDNPSGRVSVSLIALEDMIKKTLSRTIEIKEAKPDISASKKGMQVRLKLTLRSETHIPDLTSRVQELVKRKIQEMIGLDEPINVTIFVGKISGDQDKDKHQGEKIMDDKPSSIPFQGYRA